MTWENETGIDQVDDLFKKLLSMWKKNDPIAYRGQADKNWLLQTSLDRILNLNADYTTKLSEELVILKKFYARAREYLGMNEKERLDQLHVNNKISALTILQHYHAPTRMLDWTHSPLVALYCAAIELKDKDGVIWWFKPIAFTEEVHQRWDNKYYMKRYPPDNDVNLNDTAFDYDGPTWITMLGCRFPFHRIEVQQGFFTVAGRLGSEHGDLIEDVLSKDSKKYGRFVVPVSWKQEILDRLRNMNIHAQSIDYPGADLVGIDLIRELKRSQRIDCED